jgi:hypothetical protein
LITLSARIVRAIYSRRVTLEELIVSSLAQTDAQAKL